MTVLTDAMVAERVESLVDLGFTLDQADQLARARDPRGFLVEIHAVRNALERGCDTDTAFEIYS